MKCLNCYHDVYLWDGVLYCDHCPHQENVSLPPRAFPLYYHEFVEQAFVVEIAEFRDSIPVGP